MNTNMTCCYTKSSETVQLRIKDFFGITLIIKFTFILKKVSLGPFLTLFYNYSFGVAFMCDFIRLFILY